VGQGARRRSGRSERRASRVPRGHLPRRPLHHAQAASCSGQLAIHLRPRCRRVRAIQITDQWSPGPPAGADGPSWQAPRGEWHRCNGWLAALKPWPRQTPAGFRPSSQEQASTRLGKIRAVSGPKRSRKPVRTNGRLHHPSLGGSLSGICWLLACTRVGALPYPRAAHWPHRFDDLPAAVGDRGCRFAGLPGSPGTRAGPS